MSRGVNKCIIIGNLGDNPKVTYMPNGNAVANITVATTESWKDKNSGDQVDRTEWHRVVFFRRLAEIVGEYLKKGSKVYIEGKLQTRKWQDKEGKDNWTTEIIAHEMQMLDSRGGQQEGHTQHGSTQQSGGSNQAAPASDGGMPAASNNNIDPDFDDEIPF